MQLGQQEEALADFNCAVMQDSENSDIYHHRGQVRHWINDVDVADAAAFEHVHKIR